MLDKIEYILLIYGWWILLAQGTVIVFYLLAQHVYLIATIQTKLNFIKSYLEKNLGDKSGEFIDIWIKGLESIKDGNFTEEEMIEQFINIIKIKTEAQKLSTEEQKVIKSAVELTVQSFTNQKSKNVAFKILSKS